MQKEFSYGIRNLNRDKDMGNRLFVNLLVNDMLKKLQSDFSPDDVSRNLPSLLPLPVGGKYVCLLATDLIPGGVRYQTLGNLGVSKIEMVGMN